MLILREFAAEEEADLQELLESEPEYVERVTGYPVGPSDALSLLISRPPGVEKEDKIVLGAWRDALLVGLVDLLRGYPDDETVWISLLLVRGAEQRKGIGREVHRMVEEFVAQWPGIRRFRLGIVATNAHVAEPFWSRLGYRPTDESRPDRYDKLESTVTVYQKPLRSRA